MFCDVDADVGGGMTFCRPVAGWALSLEAE